MDNYEERIGNNIREERRKKGYSQDKLSAMCGIKNTTLSAYENSKKIPNVITLARIAQALKVSIDRLYFGDENLSFINMVEDEGRKIVNCIYTLWNKGVIFYVENYGVSTSYMEVWADTEINGFFLGVSRYSITIKRLMQSLNEFRDRRSTFDDPENYLEIILSSFAKEINDRIEREKKEGYISM